MADIGWVFYSPDQKRQVDYALEYFGDQGIVDELGLGTVRDTFADIFFPGTSTIQTRAKYFLLVPFCMREIEKSSYQVENYRDNLRKKEIALIGSLMKGDDKDGIIGKNKKEKLQRFPSSIYWNGLKLFGIVNVPNNLSLAEYYTVRKFLNKREKGVVTERSKKFEEWNDDFDAYELKTFWASLPTPTNNWLENESIELSKEEAEYLKTKILANQGDSLLGTLLKQEIDISEFDSLYEFYLKFHNKLDSKLAKTIKTACDFEIVMRGAIILYNVLLNEVKEVKFKKNPEIYLRQWKKDLANYDLQGFSPDVVESYLHPRVKGRVMNFITQWFNLVMENEVKTPKAKELIERREYQIKKGRARLNSPERASKITSYTALLTYDDGIDHSLYLNYRFNVAQRILSDINDGLNYA